MEIQRQQGGKKSENERSLSLWYIQIQETLNNQIPSQIKIKIYTKVISIKIPILFGPRVRIAKLEE